MTYVSVADDTSPNEFPGKPYGGLLGDSVALRVVEELVADPDTVYAPTDLAELTDASPPAVRKVLNELVELRFVMLANKNPKRPIYRVAKSANRFLALELLAYARLDDREGTTLFQDRIREMADRLEFDASMKMWRDFFISSTAPTGNQESEMTSDLDQSMNVYHALQAKDA